MNKLTNFNDCINCKNPLVYNGNAECIECVKCHKYTISFFYKKYTGPNFIIESEIFEENNMQAVRRYDETCMHIFSYGTSTNPFYHCVKTLDICLDIVKVLKSHLLF